MIFCRSRYATSYRLLVNNKDPRLLYFFQRMTTILMLCRLILIKKRNAGFCRKNVISEVKNGKKVFKEWGGPGEPWVRYYGLPVEIGAGQMDKYEDYFDPKGQLFVLYSAAGAKKAIIRVLTGIKNGKRFVDIYLSGCSGCYSGSGHSTIWLVWSVFFGSGNQFLLG